MPKPLATLVLLLALLFAGSYSHAQFSQPGELDTSFSPDTGANNYVEAVAVQPDGKILIVGSFTTYNGNPRNRIARSNADGSLDATFNPGTGASTDVYSIALQPNGKVLIGGAFSHYNGIFSNYIARLNSDGTLDATFNTGGALNGPVWAVFVQPDGKVLIGGGFTSYNSTSRNYIARLNADGSLDATFNPGTGTLGTVRSFALQPDGKVLIGGDFTTYNGISRKGIARLNADATLDASFNPGTGAAGYTGVYNVTIQPDGKVLIGGQFTSFNGSSRNGIARLNIDGSLDATFSPGTGANNWVYSLALQPDGKVLIVGDFTSYNGTTRNRVARLNADGSLDANFNPSTGPSGVVFPTVRSLALQPDGKVLIGGEFTLYNGTPRNRIARVIATGAITGWSDEGFITEHEFSIYPVPFRSQFTIQAKAPFHYEIMDLRGVVQLSGFGKNAEAICLTENLATGIYMLKFTVNGQTYVRKVVKE